MYKILFILVAILGVGIGYLRNDIGNPYALDYNKIVMNLPINYNTHLDNKTYGLGEKYLAEDIKIEFIKNGFDVDIYTWEDTYSNKNFKEGFEFYMRGWPELKLKNYHEHIDRDRISVLYETIPYELEGVKNVDIVFTSSYKRNKLYKEMGLNSYFMPQYTRFDKFYPAYDEKYKTKLLFIGNNWHYDVVRKTILYSIKNNLEVDIYGKGWDNIIDEEHKHLLKGEQILPDDLKYYYSSADIVFNDTRQDMIDNGFISNRIFDVTACGGFLISDYIAEIEEIFGDSIVMYKNEEEFIKLTEYYLAHPEERKEKAQKAHEITMKNFGAETGIRKMSEILREYAKKYEGVNE